MTNAADCPLTRRLRGDLAEGESGVLADDGGGWVDPKLLRAPVCLVFLPLCLACRYPIFSDSCSGALDKTTCKLLDEAVQGYEQ